MAKLWKRKDGSGCYIRGNIGAPVTWQVHPHAIRYLNKRGVYVGDEIPPNLMQKLKATEGWLYTKEEYPFVVFDEFRDPTFGTRSKGRSAVQGTTRVYSFNYSTGSARSRLDTQAPIRQSSRRRATSQQPPKNDPNLNSKKRRKLTAEEQSKKAKPELDRAKAARAKLEQEIAEEFERKNKTSKVETTWILPNTQTHIDGAPEIGAADRQAMDTFDLKSMKQPATLFSRLRHWYVSGGDLPLWMVILFVVLLLVASLILSRVM